MARMTAAEHAIANQAALALIEASSVAYHGVDDHQANAHQFRAHEAFKRIADALGYDVTKAGDPAAVSEWQSIKTAPRDGQWVWLFNKHSGDPMRLFWSTNYSIFGLGGCWTDGFCTMGDGIDFDFWCPVLPADYVNPHHAAPAEAAE